MPDYPEVYEPKVGDLLKLRFHSLAEGAKKSGDGRWYKIIITGKSGEQRFIWSSPEVNAKLSEWGVGQGESIVLQKLEGYNKFHLEYESKEADCSPPPRSGGGSGGGKRNSNWVKYSPQDVLKTMEWCREHGGDDWKLLFNGCCAAKAFSGGTTAGADKAESSKEIEVENKDDVDDSLPFN